MFKDSCLTMNDLWFSLYAGPLLDYNFCFELCEYLGARFGWKFEHQRTRTHDRFRLLDEDINLHIYHTSNNRYQLSFNIDRDNSKLIEMCLDLDLDICVQLQ